MSQTVPLKMAKMKVYILCNLSQQKMDIGDRKRSIHLLTMEDVDVALSGKSILQT